MHQIESIFGTIAILIYSIVVAVWVALFWAGGASGPIWFGILVTVVFGGAAIWGLWKVGSWWYKRLKKYFSERK